MKLTLNSTFLHQKWVQLVNNSYFLHSDDLYVEFREYAIVTKFLCDELITRPEESYRLWCVVVCDLKTSWMRRPWPTGGCCAKKKGGEALYEGSLSFENSIWIHVTSINVHLVMFTGNVQSSLYKFSHVCRHTCTGAHTCMSAQTFFYLVSWWYTEHSKSQLCS